MAEKKAKNDGLSAHAISRAEAEQITEHCLEPKVGVPYNDFDGLKRGISRLGDVKPERDTVKDLGDA